MTKLVLRIVINRIRRRTLHEITPEQHGFMPDQGTENDIFVQRMFVERSIEKQKYVYVCFVDYSKAFDTVKHKLLVDLLQSLDVDQAALRLLINIYWNQTAAVRCDDYISAWTSIKQGVRQGCVALPPFIRLIYRNDFEGIMGHGGFQNW